MQEGWDWLQYQKLGRILAQDKINQAWADVRIDFTIKDGNSSGVYEAKVEVSVYVKTAFSSDKNEPLEEIKQYRVSHLLKIPTLLN